MVGLVGLDYSENNRDKIPQLGPDPERNHVALFPTHCEVHAAVYEMRNVDHQVS